MIDQQGRIVHEVRFPHAQERVWSAITDADEIEQWLMKSDFAPVAGQKFRMLSEPPCGWFDGEVIVVEPPTRLQMRWHLDGMDTLVTMTLRADGDGTVLDLVHENASGDLRSRLDGGWVERFEDLDKILEKSAA